MEPEIDIFWLCDRKCSACVPPGEETCMNEWCHHTSDKAHAISDLKNSPDGTLPKAFDIIPGNNGRVGYFERKDDSNGS